MKRFNYKTISQIRKALFAITLFAAPIFAFSQITVDYSGHVRLADKLTVKRYYNVTLQVLPDSNNEGYIGISGQQFYEIRGQSHYATTTLLTSDYRLKENFRSIDSPLGKIMRLNGLKYDFKPEPSDLFGTEKEIEKKAKLKKDRIGFIAQEVKEVLPEAVVFDEDEDKYYLDYNAIIPVMVEAIKEQQTQIDAIATEIENLSKKPKEKSATIENVGPELFNRATLNQNVPNPFSLTTAIGMYLPQDTLNAVLFIYNMQGVQLKQFNITQRGTTSITIDGFTLEPGMYLYTLIADGKEVDTKKMILTK